jgi:hypothetical protein
MMQIRTVNMLDFLNLRRYRRDILSLDSSQTTTHGNAFSPISLLYSLNHKLHIYTAVYEDGRRPLMGQVTQGYGEPFARLSFLSPQENLNGGEAHLLEHLASQTGEWGAMFLMAEVDEHNIAFRSLRKAGFSMYAWQKIYQLSSASEKRSDWHFPSGKEMLAVHNLYEQIVPNLVQSVEPPPVEAKGLVCFDRDELQAFASFNYGPHGIWVQPLFHPGSICAADCIQALPKAIHNFYHQPIYLCLRSYQAWLESALEDSGAVINQHQALMVKHLTIRQREEIMHTLPDKAFAKPAAPVAHTSTRKTG